jgi:Spy/CpxP family protein refolding chaperone
MKKLQTIVIAIVFFMAGLVNIYAQPGPGPHNAEMKCQKKEAGCMGIPNLTDDQQKKINDLRIAHQKEMQALHNQMGELKAKHKTLTTADKPDMKAVNANIDEITKLQNQIMKKAAEHQQQVRSLLNDEQKLWFDAHHKGGPGKGCCMGNEKCEQMCKHAGPKCPMQHGDSMQMQHKKCPKAK